MKKMSWLVVGINLLLIVGLLGCGNAKRDEVEKQLADLKADSDQKAQLAQDAASKASEKADAVLATARTEIATAKAETIVVAEEKDTVTLTSANSNMEAGDAVVKSAAEKAAESALADAKTAAMAEDVKVKEAAKEAAGKAMSAAEEADRNAANAAKEAELAKLLPEPKEPIVFSVYFNLGQTKLKKAGLAELEKAAEAIKANAGATVKIEGHTDNIPVISSQHKNNWGLSQARAKAVEKHLVDKLGVSAEAISETIGVAFYKPVAANVGADQVKNRRVDVIIMK